MGNGQVLDIVLKDLLLGTRDQILEETAERLVFGMDDLLDGNIGVVRKVGLNIQSEEVVHLLLGLEFGCHLGCSDGLLLLDIAVNKCGHLKLEL